MAKHEGEERHGDAAGHHRGAAEHYVAMASQRILPVALAGLLLVLSAGITSAAPTYKLKDLTGHYTTAGRADDASITGTVSEPNPPTAVFDAAGFLDFDGKGNITSGEETINYGSPGTGDSFTCDMTGTYTIDSATGRVILSVTVTAGPAVTASESSASNTAQCGGTGTWVGYVDRLGARLATIEQTNTGGTPTPPAVSTTPILSAHIWTK
jgi:hypothetical protein